MIEHLQCASIGIMLATITLFAGGWWGKRSARKSLPKSYDEAYWLGHAAGIAAERERIRVQLTPRAFEEVKKQDITRTTINPKAMLDVYRARCAVSDDKTNPEAVRPS